MFRNGEKEVSELLPADDLSESNQRSCRLIWDDAAPEHDSQQHQQQKSCSRIATKTGKPSIAARRKEQRVPAGKHPKSVSSPKPSVKGAPESGGNVHWGEMKRIELDPSDHKYDLPMHIDGVLQAVIVSTHERLRLELASRLAQVHERVDKALQATGMSNARDATVTPIFKTELYQKELEKHREISRQIRECDAKTKERLRLIEEVADWLMSVSGYAVTDVVSDTVLLREDDEMETITTNISDSVTVAISCIQKVKSIGYQLLVESGHSSGIAPSKLKAAPVAIEENVIIGNYGKNLEESLLIMRRCHDEIGKMVRNDYWKGWLNAARKQMHNLGHAVVRKHIEGLRMQKALVEAKSTVAKLTTTNDSLSSHAHRLSSSIAKVQGENDTLKAELKHTEGLMKSALVKAHFYEQRLNRFRREDEQQQDEQALANLLKLSNKRGSAGKEKHAQPSTKPAHAPSEPGLREPPLKQENSIALTTDASTATRVAPEIATATDASQQQEIHDVPSTALSSAINLPDEAKIPPVHKRFQPAIDAKNRIDDLEKKLSDCYKPSSHKTGVLQEAVKQHLLGRRQSRAMSVGLESVIRQKDELLWKRAQDIIEIQKEILCTFADFIEAKNVEINVDHAVVAIKQMLQDAVKKMEASMNFKMFKLDDETTAMSLDEDDPVQPAPTASVPAPAASAVLPVNTVRLPQMDPVVQTNTTVPAKARSQPQKKHKCDSGHDALKACIASVSASDLAALVDSTRYLEICQSTLIERPQSASAKKDAKPAKYALSSDGCHGKEGADVLASGKHSYACTDADVSGSVLVAGGSGAISMPNIDNRSAAATRSPSPNTEDIRSEDTELRDVPGHDDLSVTPISLPRPTSAQDNLPSSRKQADKYKQMKKQYELLIQDQAKTIKDLQAENAELKNNYSHQLMLQLQEMSKEEGQLKRDVSQVTEDFRKIARHVNQIRQQQERRYNVLLQKYDKLLKEFFLCRSELRSIREQHFHPVNSSQGLTEIQPSPTPPSSSMEQPVGQTETDKEPCEVRVVSADGPRLREEEAEHRAVLRDCLQVTKQRLTSAPLSRQTEGKLRQATAHLHDCIEDVSANIQTVLKEKHKLGEPVAFDEGRSSKGCHDILDQSSLALATRKCRLLRRGLWTAYPRLSAAKRRGDVMHRPISAQPYMMRGVTLELDVSHGLVGSGMKHGSSVARARQGLDATFSLNNADGMIGPCNKTIVDEPKMLELDVKNWSNPLKTFGRRQMLRLGTARGCYIDESVLLLPFPIKPAGPSQNTDGYVMGDCKPRPRRQAVSFNPYADCDNYGGPPATSGDLVLHVPTVNLM